MPMRMINGQLCETGLIKNKSPSGKRRCVDCAFCELVLKGKTDGNPPIWYCLKGKNGMGINRQAHNDCEFFVDSAHAKEPKKPKIADNKNQISLFGG